MNTATQPLTASQKKNINRSKKREEKRELLKKEAPKLDSKIPQVAVSTAQQAQVFHPTQDKENSKNTRVSTSVAQQVQTVTETNEEKEITDLFANQLQLQDRGYHNDDSFAPPTFDSLHRDLSQSIKSKEDGYFKFNRVQAEAALSTQRPGTYIVRPTSSDTDIAAASVRQGSKSEEAVIHYLIQYNSTNQTCHLLGSPERGFDNITKLLEFSKNSSPGLSPLAHS
jgi:hypothetical protein